MSYMPISNIMKTWKEEVKLDLQHVYVEQKS